MQAARSATRIRETGTIGPVHLDTNPGDRRIWAHFVTVARLVYVEYTAASIVSNCAQIRYVACARIIEISSSTLQAGHMKSKANGVRLEYGTQGEGQWVVMSHSLACTSAMWDEQVHALKGTYK